jgi:hypothetical protein
MSNAPNYRLPVKREPSPLPVPVWQQAAPMVVRGAALVAAGVIAEWVLRSATKKAISLPFSARKSRAVAKQRKQRAVAYTETVIVQRTIVRR